MTEPATQTMLYDANKKSALVAYVLWFVVGTLGGHRFYVGKTGSAIAILALTIIGIISSFIGIGLILLLIMGIWVLVDAFLIPGWIRNNNTVLATSLASGAIPR
jgi:TM2 domain-containing membrane protein YozV